MIVNNIYLVDKALSRGRDMCMYNNALAASIKIICYQCLYMNYVQQKKIILKTTANEHV